MLNAEYYYDEINQQLFNTMKQFPSFRMPRYGHGIN